ncbi:MAG: PAS domain S-box protein [wastewater metagenome]|nr:PAS domain S-box protein [Candidatus Loosdrechtia aerotolerans]
MRNNRQISNYAYKIQVRADGALVCECITKDAFFSITGYTIEEVNTRNSWLALVHPDDMPVVRKHLDRLFSGQPRMDEFRIITKGGEEKWLRNYVQPVWEEVQKRVTRIYGTAILF